MSDISIDQNNQAREAERAVLGGLMLETHRFDTCLLYTSPSPRDLSTSRMPSSA